MKRSPRAPLAAYNGCPFDKPLLGITDIHYHRDIDLLTLTTHRGNQIRYTQAAGAWRQLTTPPEPTK